MTRWTAAEARRRVAAVLAERGDPEKAHELEDDLYLDFVSWIASTGTEQQRDIANIVFGLSEYPFERWYG